MANLKESKVPYFRFFKIDYFRIALFLVGIIGGVFSPDYREAFVGIAVLALAWWVASIVISGGFGSYFLMLGVKFSLLKNWSNFETPAGDVPKVKFFPRKKQVVFNYAGKKVVRQKLEAVASYLETIVGSKHFVGLENSPEKMILKLKRSANDIRLVFSREDDFLSFFEKREFDDSLPLDKISSLKISDLKHLLIVGHSGSGKTSFARYLMRSFAAMGYQVIYLDPKAPLNSDLEHFGIDYRPPRKSINTLNELLRVLRLRGRLKREDIRKERDIFLFIDELPSIYAGNKEKKKAFDVRLKDLVNRAREYRVHVVLISQSGKADIVNSEIRLNCAIFVIGKPDASLTRGLGLIDDLRFSSGEYMGSYVSLGDSSFNFHLPYLAFDHEN